VTQERLTRHELSWLLAQEARGAAKTLRDEVVKVHAFSEPAPMPVGTTLDALDDAIEMLSALNTGARGNKPRRGRIDLAALVYEVAPNARMAIEPGAGTEVFGDEADLRRMVNLLLTQASSGASQPEVHIRRQDDSVRISVDLGPEVAATGELERRWLSRMATRHGGRFELEGGTQSIFLQADGASDQREVHELRQELKQAQELGEAYARELASVLSGGEIRSEPPPQASAAGVARFEAVRGATLAFERAVKGMIEALRGDIVMANKLDANGELAQSLSRRFAQLSEMAADLVQVTGVSSEEAHTRVELVEACRRAMANVAARATKYELELELDAPAALAVRAPEKLLGMVLGMVLSHALAATPRRGLVRVTLYKTELGAVAAIEDGGPPIAEAARLPLLQNSIDPSHLGRPASAALLAAHAGAAALGASLELRESARGQTEAWLTLPLSTD
jgi:two-component system OmpR family sensor kinase